MNVAENLKQLSKKDPYLIMYEDLLEQARDSEFDLDNYSFKKPLNMAEKKQSGYFEFIPTEQIKEDLKKNQEEYFNILTEAEINAEKIFNEKQELLKSSLFSLKEAEKPIFTDEEIKKGSLSKYKISLDKIDSSRKFFNIFEERCLNIVFKIQSLLFLSLSVI